jgi:hypothetical protein
MEKTLSELDSSLKKHTVVMKELCEKKNKEIDILSKIENLFSTL